MVCSISYITPSFLSLAYIPPNFKNNIIIDIIMTIESWVGIIVGISTIITSAGLGIRWLVKHYFDEIKHELKPNSGSSLKDQVTRLEEKVSEAEEQRKITNSKIDHMYEVLLDYITRSSK